MVPAVVPVVNVTVAIPEASVVDVAAEKEPPAPVFDHVTTNPLVKMGLLFASASCAVIVTEAPATGPESLDMTMYFAAAPTVKVTDVVFARADPFSVPVIVAAPVLVDDVNVAVYVPSLLSVTLDGVPRVVASATVPPLAMRLLPSASLSWTVTIEVLVPFATIEAGLALIVEVAVDAPPDVNATLAVFVRDAAFSLAEIVAEPVVAEDVSVAVYVPSPLSVVAQSLVQPAGNAPRVAETVTVPPPVVRKLPFASSS